MTQASLVRHSKWLSVVLLWALAASVAAEDLVVYRVGDGTATLVSFGNAVFLDYYSTDGTQAGTSLLRSVALPTTANGIQKQLIASGTASSEGLLTRSVDGRYIILTGYAADLGGSVSIKSTTSAAVPRVIGRVDAAGNIDTSTALTDFASGNNIRSAVSTDGTVFWASGVAASGFPGVCYAVLGGTTSVGMSTAFIDSRQVNIFDGQLYTSSDKGTNTFKGIEKIGSGLPTTGSQTVTRLTGLTDAVCASSFAFFFADLDGGVAGYDTLYIADDKAASGGIKKYSLVTGSWTYNGTMGAVADSYRGLTALVNGTTVTIYATRKGATLATGGGELVTVTDSTGYNVAPTTTPTLLVAADTNKDFRGVALGWIITGPTVSQALSTVSANPASVAADGTTPSTVTVTLKDINLLPVSGKDVLLTGNPSTSAITVVSGTTDANGQATFTVKSTTAGTVTYTATDTTDNLTVTEKAQVAFQPGPVDAGKSTVSANPSPVVADGTATSTITVTLKDANSNVVPGKTVSVAGSPTTSTITAVNGTTDANGQATFTVKSTVAGPVTYTATDTSDTVIVTQTAQVDFTPGAVSADQSTVSAPPDAVVADGTATSTVTVTLKDANGNVVSGKTVSLAGSPATSTITDINNTTDANGQATFTVKSTTANTVTYTATDTDDTIVVTQTAQVSFVPGAVNADQSTVSASPTPIAADGVATSTITVTLKDANGNVVPGKAVSVTGDPTTSTITPATNTTDASGEAKFTVTSTTVGTVTYSATDTTDNIPVIPTVQVSFTPVGGPGTQLEVRIHLTIAGGVSIAWGGGTTGKALGAVTPMDWTVQSAGTGADLGLGQTCVSSDANNGIAMYLTNTSNTGTNTRVSAAVPHAGSWAVGNVPGQDTFSIKACLGTNPEVVLSASPQELTVNTRLAVGQDQPLVVTVMTPASVSTDANVTGPADTIALVLTAAPE